MVLVVKGIFASQASESDTWLAKMGEGGANRHFEKDRSVFCHTFCDLLNSDPIYK